MMFRKLAIAAVAAFALTGAHAAALSEDGGADTGTFGDTDTFIGYGFQLTNPLDVTLDSLTEGNWYINSIVIQTRDPNTVTGLTIGANTYGAPTATPGASGSTQDYTFTFAQGTGTSYLAGGATYALNFLGGIDASLIHYVEMNVTAVPEPETYAMLLAGLGAVGFMSRRRKV